MRKQIALFLILLLSASCGRAKKQEDVFLELDNKELESQIIGYTKIVEEQVKNQTFIIRVFCRDVNDTITRYVIGADVEPSAVKFIPYHFVCEVGGRKVFFTMVAGISKYYGGKPNFFRLKEGAYLDFMKNNFPEDYKLHIEKKQKGYEILYEPEMFYLTFVKGRLVKKEVDRGLPWQ